MDLALNNLQRLTGHKPQPTNPSNAADKMYLSVFN